MDIYEGTNNRITRSLPSLDFISLAVPEIRRKKPSSKELRNDFLSCILSTFYAKILVILAIALPITESIASYDYQSFQGFYLYLHAGSIIFMVFTYIQHMRSIPNSRTKQSSSRRTTSFDLDSEDTLAQPEIFFPYDIGRSQRGSAFFQIGVTGFGIGSVIYSALQFGQYFELSSEKDCVNILKALIPLFRITFSLMQMLFIFSHSIFVRTHSAKFIDKFGLMHMIATNLSEWLYVLVQETKHDLLVSVKQKKSKGTLTDLDYQFIKSKSFETASKSYIQGNACLVTRVMESILEKLQPYLAPCAVEYSFLCSIILGLMWKSAFNNDNYSSYNLDEGSSDNQARIREKGSRCGAAYRREGRLARSRQNQFSVDCAQAHKGLFSGILVLAMTIISLIMFFELVSYKEYKDAAILQVNIWETTLFVAGTLASLYCIKILRDVEFEYVKHKLELEHLLLLVTQTGVFMYFLFQIIGGSLMGFNKNRGALFRMIKPICALIQSTCQTILIMDACRRRCTTWRHIKTKPGKQLIIFLLIINIALWFVNRVKNNHAFSHPNQMEFYGVLAWNIITHVTMPLVVSYRFQATVCFYEISKHVYASS